MECAFHKYKPNDKSDPQEWAKRVLLDNEILIKQIERTGSDIDLLTIQKVRNLANSDN